MKVESLTFYCDATGCSAVVSHSLIDGTTGAHLSLVEGGWQVNRTLNGWKHYCPEHHGWKKATS